MYQQVSRWQSTKESYHQILQQSFGPIGAKVDSASEIGRLLQKDGVGARHFADIDRNALQSMFRSLYWKDSAHSPSFEPKICSS